MSIKLAFLVLLGLIVLAGALPAKNDEPEDEDAADEISRIEQDPSSYRYRYKKKPMYCVKYTKKRRCRKKCVYNRVKLYKSYRKKRVCFNLCCDYLYKRRYRCGYCYQKCRYYGYRRRCKLVCGGRPRPYYGR